MALRILLADDNPDALTVLTTVLEREGFEIVATARDGARAAELAKQWHPDICLLDLAMPRVNGLTATRQIVTAVADTRVIIVSAHSTEKLIKDAFTAGARGYLVKGDRSRELVRGIREVANGRIYLSPTASRFIAEPYLPKAQKKPEGGR
jgi:DNA-binding NarL/FixJ family response regulator